MKLKSVIERIEARTLFSSKCWLWTGAKISAGYGLISVNGKRFYVHRLVFEFVFGKLGELLVCHHCDVTNCVNPFHMFAGTDLDNSIDKYQKGRAVNPPGNNYIGEQCVNSIVTTSQVKEIKKRFSSKKRNGMKLAKEFGLSRSGIESIIKGRTWRHISL